MPKYIGDMTNAVGSLLTVLDAVLPLHANWSVHDEAAGTNEKVYKCDGDVLFYVWIGDNQTNYSNIRAWAAWDAGTHTGSGSQTANAVLCKSRSTYHIYVNGNRFVYINLDETYAHGAYCGLLKRIDISKKLVLVYAAASATYYATYNNLAGYDDGTYTRLRLMEDVDGNANVAAHPFGDGQGEAYHFFQDLDGRIRMSETLIYFPSANPRYIAGFLDGVFCSYLTPTGFPDGSGDIVTVNGMDWVFYLSTSAGSGFFVRLED